MEVTEFESTLPKTKGNSESEKLDQILKNVALNVQEELIHLFQPQSRRVIVLSGPTGVGKTRLSLQLAERLNGEIISADSMQVYRGMDIGTAKATKEERERIPHHLIDIVDVTEPFNVKEFFDEAKASIDSILARGKTPIVVGGTGFYIHALIYGPPSGPPSDPAIREALELEEEKFGIEFLYDKLRTFDPIYASTITMSDRHKVLRALEIIEISGKRVSDFAWKVRHPLPQYDYRLWFLYKPRPLLYKQLEARCDEMLKQGLLDEVVLLDRAGIRSNRTAAQAIGYRQTLDFLDTAKTSEDYNRYVEVFKMASRHLAKRQFTWFRKEPHFRWVDMTAHSDEAILDLISDDYLSGLPYDYNVGGDSEPNHSDMDQTE